MVHGVVTGWLCPYLLTGVRGEVPSIKGALQIGVYGLQFASESQKCNAVQSLSTPSLARLSRIQTSTVYTVLYASPANAVAFFVHCGSRKLNLTRSKVTGCDFRRQMNCQDMASSTKLERNIHIRRSVIEKGKRRPMKWKQLSVENVAKRLAAFRNQKMSDLKQSVASPALLRGWPFQDENGWLNNGFLDAQICPLIALSLR